MFNYISSLLKSIYNDIWERRIRIIFQGLMFFNSTFIYIMFLNFTNSKEIVFYSVFLVGLGFLTNMAIQLNEFDFSKFNWLLKIISLSLVLFMINRMDKIQSIPVLLTIILILIFTNRRSLLNPPSDFILRALFILIFINLFLLMIIIIYNIHIDVNFLIICLMLPNLILILPRNNIKVETVSRRNFSKNSIYVIFSQIFPIFSAFIFLLILSQEGNILLIKEFILYERLVAIGGSLIYLLARMKISFVHFNQRYFFVTGMSILLILSIYFKCFEIWQLSMIYLLLGIYLSLETIIISKDYGIIIFLVNGLSFFFVILSYFLLVKICSLVDLYSLYMLIQIVLIVILFKYRSDLKYA